MADNKFSCAGGANALRETFGVEAGRILDACRDRDCYEDVRVYLTADGEDLITKTGSVRVKKACISGANIVTSPVQFNSGFYTVDVKYYVNCVFEVCVPIGVSREFDGVAVVEKRVVLYGGESNVNVFRSNADGGSYCAVPDLVCCSKKNPEAIVEVLEPVVLGAKILDSASDCHCCCCCCDIPSQISDQVNGALLDEDGNGRYLAISLGFFSVIRLVRDGQFLIQASEYSLPDKECSAPCEDNPCATFRNIPFPTSEFCASPVAINAVHGGNKRCCGNS